MTLDDTFTAIIAYLNDHDMADCLRPDVDTGNCSRLEISDV